MSTLAGMTTSITDLEFRIYVCAMPLTISMSDLVCQPLRGLFANSGNINNAEVFLHRAADLQT